MANLAYCHPLCKTLICFLIFSLIGTLHLSSLKIWMPFCHWPTKGGRKLAKINHETYLFIYLYLTDLQTWIEMVSEVAPKCFSTTLPTLCAIRNRSATSSGHRSRKRSTGRSGQTRTSEGWIVKVQMRIWLPRKNSVSPLACNLFLVTPIWLNFFCSTKTWG